MALKCILLNEISQTQRAACCMVLFTCHSGKGKKYQDREKISGGQSRGLIEGIHRVGKWSVS